jgi:phage antirepressor YoqD-like protein
MITWMQRHKKFKRWVTHEVLPSIRKTGSYGKPALPQTYQEALRELADRCDVIEQQKLELLEQKPKVEFFDAVADSKDAIEIASVAKVLGIKGMGRNNLFELLRNKKILMNNNCPYQKYVDGGYFRVS